MDDLASQWEFPLSYPAVFMLAWSTWLFRVNRRKHLPGHCPVCNYNLDGIESPTCPECGENHA